jgi:zinc transport system substrate-binding protein
MIRALAFLCAALVALFGCQQAPPPAPAKPLVIATIYPLWEFGRHVAGDRAEVVSLLPPGVEPHDWEPSPADLAQLERARVFVYNGAGFEAWVDRLLPEIQRRGTIVVEATQGLPLVVADQARQPDAAHARPHKGHRHDDPAQGAPDPHVWLDPVLAQAQVEAIRTALARAEPAHAAGFEEASRRFNATLAELHQKFEQGLARCGRRDIVVSHAAFTYLARRYQLLQVPITGLAPESEPSPADLAAVARFARRHKVRFIFFETLVSSKLAETLAREVGARTLVLNPVEGLTTEEAAAGKGYVALMEANLANLRTALDCQ